MIYVNPAHQSARLSEIGRGREVAVLEQAHGWVNVVGTVASEPRPGERERPQRDRLDRSTRASSPRRRRTATRSCTAKRLTASRRRAIAAGAPTPTSDAMRLYSRLVEYFPQSPLAAEAPYRAADIRWQIEVVDAAIATVGEDARSATSHHQMMKTTCAQVMKKYPGHQVGRSGGLSPDRQQAVRRLGGGGEVSGDGSRALHEIRRGASAVAESVRRRCTRRRGATRR